MKTIINYSIFFIVTFCNFSFSLFPIWDSKKTILENKCFKNPKSTETWLDSMEAVKLIKAIDNAISKLRKIKMHREIIFSEKKSNLNNEQYSLYEHEINDLKARINELEISKIDMQMLREDKYHTYKFSRWEGCVNQVTKDEDGIIYIHGINDALIIHEIRHVSQSLIKNSGQLFFNKDNKLKSVNPWGYKDEMYAYRAQYGFNPHTLPGPNLRDISSVNLDFLHNLTNDRGVPLYISINDLSKTLKKN